MNLKVAHLVSIQFGIFIGIVACLVFSRFELSRPRTAAERREPATERYAAVEPKPVTGDELADMVDDRELEPAEPLAEQPTDAMPTEYSPEAVEKSMAILTKLYYEQIAPRRNASAIAANNSDAALAPSYTEVPQEPAAAQMDDSQAQTAAYVQPNQVIVYPQPVQVVVFPQSRRFASRRRLALPGALAPNSHRRRDSGGTHLNGLPEFESPASPSGALPGSPRSPGPGERQTTGVPNCASTQGFTPGGRR
jgi:hypothetical protein